MAELEAGHRSVGKGGAQRAVARGALRVEAAGHVGGLGWFRAKVG